LPVTVPEIASTFSLIVVLRPLKIAERENTREEGNALRGLPSPPARWSASTG
jgi:hypothetical protein